MKKDEASELRTNVYIYGDGFRTMMYPASCLYFKQVTVRCMIIPKAPLFFAALYRKDEGELSQAPAVGRYFAGD